MEYIQKLPYVLAAFMTIIIGSVSYANGIDQNDIYLRMIISLVIFLCIGFCLRALFTRIQEEIDAERGKEVLAEMEKQAKESATGSAIDLRIDDATGPQDNFNEDFSPLTVSQIIRTKIKDE